MQIIDKYKKSKKPLLSFEVFPPRNGSLNENPLMTVANLCQYNPDYISITHSSNRSLRGGSVALSHIIKEAFNIEVLSHLTCSGRSMYDIENMLTEFRYLGLENILALRGDPPEGLEEKGFIPHPEGHRYATQLIQQIQAMNQGKYIKRENDHVWYKEVSKKSSFKPGKPSRFSIAAACNPEKHPECESMELYIQHLKQKTDAGADFMITQAFYKTEIYTGFVKKLRDAGISVPIVPLIFPIRNVGSLNFVKDKFHVEVPEELEKEILKYGDENLYGLRGVVNEYLLDMCKRLIDAGAPGIHISTSLTNPEQKQIKRFFNEGLAKLLQA